LWQVTNLQANIFFNPDPFTYQLCGTAVEQIGHGGFGVVYLAEQKEPVKRRVALKVIKINWPSGEK